MSEPMTEAELTAIRERRARMRYAKRCSVPSAATLDRDQMKEDISRLLEEVGRLKELNEDKFRTIEAYRKAASEDKATIQRLQDQVDRWELGARDAAAAFGGGAGAADDAPSATRCTPTVGGFEADADGG